MKSLKSRITILLLLLLAINFGCSEDYGDVPECIKDEIEVFKKDACDEVSSIRLYQFQQQEVYLFDLQSCFDDGASNVISNECEVLGILGTEAGFDGIKGVNFFENATLIRVVWEN
ncbi:MAG: hypothetical protein ACJA1A_000582 [Saprospiraceae bacterium]|jgi:hypothetical protein|tara:strand:- start:1207 stop:1554 length:348 start_codon:yes stop_codon:yes gene_type:complete